MSIQAPEQVDLNQDLQDQGIQLSPDQQEKYDVYLNSLEDAEKQDIIYLTQEELGELKRILDEDDSAQHDADFDEFIAEQRAEGFSLSDTLGLSEEQNEKLDFIQGQSQEVLFGSEGIFKEHDMSPTAQDNASAGLALALTKKALDQDGNIQVEEFTTIFSQFETALQDLTQLSSETLPVMGSPLALNISNNGEGNAIFMHPEIGAEFYSELIDGQLTGREAIKDRIEGENTSEELTINKEILESLAAEFMSSPEDILVETQDLLPSPVEVPATDATAEEKQDYLDRLRGTGPIGEFLAAIFEFMNGITGDNEEETAQMQGEDEGNAPEVEEIAPTTLENARNLFRTKISEGAADPSTIAQIQNLFPENGELSDTAKEIIKAIDDISEETLEESFNNLFGEREGFETTKFQEFTTASGDLFIQEGEPTTSEGLLAILKEYNTYRAGNTRALYTDYFSSRASNDTDQN